MWLVGGIVEEFQVKRLQHLGATVHRCEIFHRNRGLPQKQQIEKQVWDLKWVELHRGKGPNLHRRNFSCHFLCRHLMR